MAEPKLRVLRYPPGITLNASVNRDRAVQCLKSGMTPAQVAAEFPRVFSCGENGKLAQIYDSVIAGTITPECPEGLRETRYTILQVAVDRVIRRYERKRRQQQETKV